MEGTKLEENGNAHTENNYANPVKYCQNCGSPLNRGAAVCLRCGSLIAETVKKAENPVLGLLALVFGILGGWLGLILGAIGLGTYKEEKNRQNCKIGIGFFVGEAIISIIVVAVIMSAI